MCGIVAIARKSEPVDENILRQAVEALHHRGPDGRKTWIAPSGQVGLAHTRLSIIDLHTGDQPLSNEDGSIHAVVNGELYGFQAIRSELEQKGHVFKTRSDSEILIHLYEEYGAQCVHRLRGEFAFVLWDDNQQKLIAARDRFGIKPLFYAFRGQDLLLASEIKALKAAGMSLHWDEESFYHANLMGSFSQDRTLFQGVYQVPPGNMIIATRGHFRLHQYWDFDYPQASELSKPHDERAMIDEFGAVLEDAVRLRLHADVPVACYLSGGLDSCAVLGLAAKHAAGPVEAFTLGFDHDDYDETHIAREMAAKAGANFHAIPMTQETLALNFEDAVFNAETLLSNAHGVAKFMLSRAVRDAGYKVVLTGEGSDEILAGYPHFRRDKVLYQSQDLSSAHKEELLAQLGASNKVSSAILLPHGETPPAPAIIEKTIGFFPSWMMAFSTGGARFKNLYSDAFASKTNHMAVYQSLTDGLDIARQLNGRDPITKSMYLWSKVFLPNYILSVLGDRMEMAHSIEGRVPFLDHVVVETARRLPSSLKISGMTEKYVLREAVKPYITDEVYRRQKHPFMSPPATLKREGRLSQLLRDSVASASFKNQPFFDQTRVAAFIESLDKADDMTKAASDVVLTAILSTSVLQQRFGVS
jgi:asparagine synthase (glutamine-hydrolysing)